MSLPVQVFPKSLNVSSTAAKPTMPLWRGDIRDGIKFLRHSFARLRRRKIWENVRGGAYLLEIKIKDTGAHIHLHCLADADFIPYRKLWGVWKEIIQADVPQIDIRAASTANAKTYITKDASKSAAFDTHPEHIVTWYHATRGLRLWGTFGKWFNIKLNELENRWELPPAPPPCPYCGAIGSAFYARDGPRIYGYEDWKSIAPSIVPDGDYYRPIAWVVKELSEPERPESDQRQEEMLCNSQVSV